MELHALFSYKPLLIWWIYLDDIDITQDVVDSGIQPSTIHHLIDCIAFIGNCSLVVICGRGVAP